MTDTRCWLEFDNDAELTKKIERGYFEEEGGNVFSPWSFPPAPGMCPYWPVLFSKWCVKRDIETEYLSHLVMAAEVEKAQIIDFIEYIYGDAPEYHDPARMLCWNGKAGQANRLINLKAFVAQELRADVLYTLVADEF